MPNEVVRVRAWRTDAEYGYDRWKADEQSLGRGTHDAVLVLCESGQSRDALAERLKRTLAEKKGDAS